MTHFVFTERDGGLCAVETCAIKARSRGLCATHYSEVSRLMKRRPSEKKGEASGTLYVRLRPPELIDELDRAVSSLYYPSRAALVASILRGEQEWPWVASKKGKAP